MTSPRCSIRAFKGRPDSRFRRVNSAALLVLCSMATSGCGPGRAPDSDLRPTFIADGTLEPSARLWNTDRACVRLADDVLADATPGDDATIDRLVRCLPGEMFYQERGAAGAALAHLGTRAVPKLVEALASNNPRLTEGAVRVLGALGPAARNAVPSLQSIVISSEPTTLMLPEYAAEALGRIGDIDFLIRIVERKESTEHIELGAQGLAAAGAGGAAGVPALLAMRNGPDPVTQRAAAEALGKIGSASNVAVPRLAELSRRGPRFTQRAAGEALQKIDTPESRHAIRPYEERERRSRLISTTLGPILIPLATYPWVSALLGLLFGGWAFQSRRHSAIKRADRLLLVTAALWGVYTFARYASQRGGTMIPLEVILIFPPLLVLTIAVVSVRGVQPLMRRRQDHGQRTLAQSQQQD